MWEKVSIFAFNKTVKSLTSPVRNIISLSASLSFTFKILFSTTKSLSHIIYRILINDFWCSDIKYIFIDFIFSKPKPTLVGFIYKPSNQTRFLEQLITEFEERDLKNEHYILGYFNINLLFNGTSILDKPNKTKKFYK